MADLHIGKGVDLPIGFAMTKAAILAMTGQGKTYLARAIAEEMLKAGVRIVVADYTGVWWGLQSSASGKREGFPVVIFGGEHADVPINPDAGSLIADVVVNERISAVLDTSGFEDDAPKIRFMNQFSRRLYHINKRPIHFFIDEADEWVPQQPQKDQIALLSIVKRIWQRGRVKGIGGTLISQRAALVNKSLLSQSETLIALRTVAPQDRAALEAWFESWGSEDEIATFTKTISNLPDYHAWFWSPRHRLFVQTKARPIETFDSMKTPDISDDVIAEPERRTKIDVGKLGEKIAKLAEDAKSYDPAVLKKQVEHWKREHGKALAELAHAKRPLVVKEEKDRKQVKVPYLLPKTLQCLRATIRSLQKLRREFSDVFVDVENAAGRLEGDMTKAADTFERSRMMPARSEMPRDISNIHPAQLKHAFSSDKHTILRPEDLNVPIGFAKTAAAKNGDLVDVIPPSNGSKPTGMRRMMIALAQHGRSTKGRLRALAGIESKATLDTYISKLRAMHHVVISGGDYVDPTPEGIAALGSYEPLPTGPALIEYWKHELGSGGMGKIFSVLIEDRGVIFGPEALMQATGIKSRSTLDTYVSKLAIRGLVTRMAGGQVKVASDFENI